MESNINLGTANDAEVIIATPFYNVQAYAPYTASLVASLQACWQAGIKAYYWQICGDSYVWHVRNSFAHMFLTKTNAKYLIFIDSDHAWDLPGFMNLLKAPEDVVGAAYPCKNNWEFWSVEHAVSEDDRKPLGNLETGLIHAYKVPTGMMKISRKAFERVSASEPDNWYDEDDGRIHGYFNHILENGRNFGEDISFCIRCERAGIPLWIEPNITISHFGVEAHTGNYYDFLRRRPGGDLYGNTLPDYGESKSIKDLEGKYQGQTAYIVGKGPSISGLTADEIKDGPVIALNEAIVKVEQLGIPNPIYSMQKDGNAATEVCPKNAALLVHKKESINSFPGYSPRYVFDNQNDFDLPWNSPSVLSATMLANMMGCQKIVYVSCDASMNGDFREAVPQEDGSTNIMGEVSSYDKHRKWIDSVLEYTGMAVEWLKPAVEGQHDFK